MRCCKPYLFGGDRGFFFFFPRFWGGSILRAGRDVAHRSGLLTTELGGDEDKQEIERYRRTIEDHQVLLLFGWGTLVLWWSVSGLVIEPLAEVWITNYKMFSGSTKVECNVFAFFAGGTYAWVNEKGDIHVVHVLTRIQRASVCVANQSVTRV